MEDVPLSDVDKDQTKTRAEKAPSIVDNGATEPTPSHSTLQSEIAEADSTSTLPTSKNTGMWCCNRSSKKKVECGADLGVWESSLEDRAGCLSRWMIFYVSPLIKLGSRKVLDKDDIGVPPKQDVAATVHDKTISVWTKMSANCSVANEKLKLDYVTRLEKCQTDEERKKVKEPKYKEPKYKEPSIAWTLVKGFGVWELTLGLIYYAISAVLSFVPILILNDLVKFFEVGADISLWNGYANPWVEVAGLAVTPFLVSLLQTRQQIIYAHCSIFARTAVSTMLYRKALRVSAAGRAKTSTGQVVNMMSNDTAQLQRFLQFIGLILVAPLQIVIALVLIYKQVR